MAQYAPSWLQWEEASGGRAVLQGTVQDIRQAYDGLVAVLAPMMPSFPDGVDVTEGDADGVAYRIYTPKDKSGPFPIAIWTHGGGYCTGDLNSDHFICANIAEHTESAVVNIDYRLAPEHVWPAQLDDCLKVYKWAHKNASSFKGDNTKMYTCGGSAGGGLALQIANQIVKDPQYKSSLKGIAAQVPCTTHWENVPEKYKSNYTAYDDNASGVPIIDKATMKTFYDAVKADPTDADAFTILATDNHKNYPPTYFTSCGFDPLRDDAYIMEDALKEAGVKTKHDHYEQFPHFFWIIPAVPEGQTYVQNLIGGIEWLKSQF